MPHQCATRQQLQNLENSTVRSLALLHAAVKDLNNCQNASALSATPDGAPMCRGISANTITATAKYPNAFTQDSGTLEWGNYAGRNGWKGTLVGSSSLKPVYLMYVADRSEQKQHDSQFTATWRIYVTQSAGVTGLRSYKYTENVDEDQRGHECPPGLNTGLRTTWTAYVPYPLYDKLELTLGQA